MISPQTLLEYHGLELQPELTTALENCFAAIGADEGTLWLLNHPNQALVPVWNSGPNAAEFVGHHAQPLDMGLVSVVFVTEQCLCENEVYKNADQDPTLDRKLRVLTCSMIAVPFRHRGATRGVISCVRLKPSNSPEPSPPPFSAADLIQVTKTIGSVQEATGVSAGEKNASQ